MDIANGCSATEVQSKEDSFVNRFGRKISFRHFHEFIKANKQYVFNKDIPHATCLCEICENVVDFMQALNQHLPKELILPTNPHDIVEKFSCSSGNNDCMNSKCNVCETPEEIAEVLSSGEVEADNIIFNEWAKVDDRVQKLSTSIDVEEISSRLNAYVKTLKKHIHVK